MQLCRSCAATSAGFYIIERFGILKPVVFENTLYRGPITQIPQTMHAHLIALCRQMGSVDESFSENFSEGQTVIEPIRVGGITSILLKRLTFDDKGKTVFVVLQDSEKG